MGQRQSAIVLQRAEIWTRVAGVAEFIQKATWRRARVAASGVVAQVITFARDAATGVDEVCAVRAGLKDRAANEEGRGIADIDDAASSWAAVPPEGGTLDRARSGVIQ